MGSLRVNVSQMNMYDECPQKWYNRYVVRRERDWASNAVLEGGTIFHLAMESYFADGKKWHHGVGILSAQGLLEIKIREATDEKLIDILKDFQKKFEFKPEPIYYRLDQVIGTEVELTMPIGKHTLVGRLDAIVEDDEGVLWHVQNRGLALNTKMGPYLESRSMDPHELAYGALLQYNYPGRRIGGTISNFVKKGGIPNADKWYEDQIPWSESRWKDMERDYLVNLNDMEKIIEQYQPPVKRRASCRSAYGGMCPYFESCAYGKSIYGEGFRDVPKEYYQGEADEHEA